MTSERKFIKENVKRVLLKEYLKRRTERSGFGGLDIQRTPMGTRVTLIAERPGMVIGRKGETIKELTNHVQYQFKFDNPQIEVKEVSNPNLNPHIMAQKLASALERGWHFRRAGHSTVRRIMGAGAKGCQVIISGKLTGQRHRTEKFREGHVKYCGESKLIWMHEGFAVAKKKLGVIGVKVQIMDPNARLPDEIEVRELKDVAEIKTITEPSKAEPQVEAEIIDEDKVKEEEKVDGEEVQEKEEAPDEVESDKQDEPKDTKKPKVEKSKTKKEKEKKKPAEKKKAKAEKKEPKDVEENKEKVKDKVEVGDDVKEEIKEQVNDNDEAKTQESDVQPKSEENVAHEAEVLKSQSPEVKDEGPKPEDKETKDGEGTKEEAREENVDTEPEKDSEKK